MFLQSHVRCSAVWSGLEFSQNHNCTIPHFCSLMCDTMYKMLFEVSIFFKFWAFLTQPKTNFSLFFGPSFKLLSQFFFILGWLVLSTLARVIKLFFFLKTRVIKILIIYLILKIKKYINIQRGCGVFVQFSYYKTTNRTAPCGVVRLCHFAGGFGAVCAIYVVW